MRIPTVCPALMCLCHSERQEACLSFQTLCPLVNCGNLPTLMLLPWHQPCPPAGSQCVTDVSYPHMESSLPRPWWECCLPYSDHSFPLQGCLSHPSMCDFDQHDHIMYICNYYARRCGSILLPPQPQPPLFATYLILKPASCPTTHMCTEYYLVCE